MRYLKMKMSKVNKLNVSLSKLGFGAMRLPHKNEEIDQEQVNEMVKYAVDNGVNYFDTAYIYNNGGSETALGIALKQVKREDVFIADKLPMRKIVSKEGLDDLFNTSLERLQTDYIDFYLMHALEGELLDTIIKYDVISWALQKKKEGKIKYLGFSIHDDYEFLLKVLNLNDWDFAQIQFNYLDLDDNPGEKGYLELSKRNIPIVIMEPLKGGLLSDIPDSVAKPFRDIGGSNVSYSFRWLAEKEGIVTILSGMSNMAQLKENVEIFKYIQPLNTEEHKAILEVEQNLRALQKVKCTGCRYCMPCPFGVEIPDIFKGWNTKSIHSGSNWISGSHIDYESAAKCVECGQCMTHCPQHIQIPDMLKSVISEKE
jgi:predicted aldo/keto reductase-like oxidoreductase